MIRSRSPASRVRIWGSRTRVASDLRLDAAELLAELAAFSYAVPPSIEPKSEDNTDDDHHDLDQQGSR